MGLGFVASQVRSEGEPRGGADNTGDGPVLARV